MAYGYGCISWAIGLLVLVAFMSRPTSGSIDCSVITTLFFNCSNYIAYGARGPSLGSPCCNALVSLNNMADSVDNRRSMCGCLMGIITTDNPNATALARLPGLCGVSFGFTIDPNTDCNNVP